MKKRVWNKTGTRQLIDSGWKEFDRQTNCITRGNAFCSTQYSCCVRPWDEVECNGMTFKLGELMNADLKAFSRLQMPHSIREILTDRNRCDKVWAYVFFTMNKSKNIEPFGWVVTNYNHSLLADCVVCGRGRNFKKRWNALNECIAYITE